MNDSASMDSGLTNPESEASHWRREAKDARLAHLAAEATIASVVQIIGGEVEGYPTGRINLLQRLRQLINIEADYISGDESAAKPPRTAGCANQYHGETPNAAELCPLSEAVCRRFGLMGKSTDAEMAQWLEERFTHESKRRSERELADHAFYDFHGVHPPKGGGLLQDGTDAINEVVEATSLGHGDPLDWLRIAKDRDRSESLVTFSHRTLQTIIDAMDAIRTQTRPHYDDPQTFAKGGDTEHGLNALAQGMEDSQYVEPHCADTTSCCRELTRVWNALGVTGYTGKSASQHVKELVAGDRPLSTDLNWHAIVGPNGMCMCGVDADGTVVRCGDLLRRSLTAMLEEPSVSAGATPVETGVTESAQHVSSSPRSHP